MNIDEKAVLAVLIALGCFGLLGGFVITGGKLDTGTGVALVAFCGQPLAGIIGFYFGKSNGVQAGLAQSSLQLAQTALIASAQRRAGDPVTGGITPAVSPTPPPTGGTP